MNDDFDIPLDVVDFDLPIDEPTDRMVKLDEMRWTSEFQYPFDGDIPNLLVQTLQLASARAEMLSVALDMIAERDRRIARLQEQLAQVKDEFRAARNEA